MLFIMSTLAWENGFSALWYPTMFMKGKVLNPKSKQRSFSILLIKRRLRNLRRSQRGIKGEIRRRNRGCC